MGLLLILGALWWFLRRRKRTPADNGVMQQSQQPGFSEMESSEQQRHELVGEGVGYKKIRQSSLGGEGVPERYELGAAGGR